MLLRRSFGRRDRDQLALGELVLAQHPPRIPPRRARLGTEAGGQGGVAQRQVVFGEDAVADEVCQRNFGGGDEPEIRSDFLSVKLSAFFRKRNLACPFVNVVFDPNIKSVHRVLLDKAYCSI